MLCFRFRSMAEVELNISVVVIESLIDVFFLNWNIHLQCYYV